jgi:membrane protein insertase Oxa1/YidC/SpoIIIJ
MMNDISKEEKIKDISICYYVHIRIPIFADFGHAD